MITFLFWTALVVGISATVAATTSWLAFLVWGAVLFAGANFWFTDLFLGKVGDKVADVTIGPSVPGRITSAINWTATAYVHWVIAIIVPVVTLDVAGYIPVGWAAKMGIFGLIEIAGYFVWDRRAR